MGPILTPQRLASLANRPLLRANWHFLSAAILSVCNVPHEIPALYTYTLEHTASAEHAKVTAEMRESLLKAAALIGLPRTINSLTELKNVTPRELLATAPLRQDLAGSEFVAAGETLFANVYGKITRRIHHQLDTAYPDLDWFVVRHEYGPLLAFDKVLDARQTSLVIVASLVPQDVNPQLKGHLKGALNNGASRDEVNAARDLALEIAQWCGIRWRGEVAKL